MKLKFTILALLVSTGLMAQVATTKDGKIKYIKTVTSEVTMANGVVLPPFEGKTAITAAQVAKLYNALPSAPPIVVVPPVTTTEKLNAIFDNVFFAANGINKNGQKVGNGDFVAQIPNSKSGVSLYASSLDQPRTEIMTYNNRYIQLDNENKFYFVSPDMQIGKPSEDWFIGLDLSGFSYEAYWNVYGKYLGDLGGQFRATNANNEFIQGRLPLYKPFVVRVQYTATNTAKYWIDNIYKGELKTYLFGSNKAFTRIGAGTDTNNAKWNFAGIFQVNHALTDTEANEAFADLQQGFGIGKDLPFPIAKSVGVGFSGKNVTAKFVYYSPTNVPIGKVDVTWYSAGNGQNPDVTNNVLVPELSGKATFDSSKYPAGTWFRTDVKVTDKNGLTFGAGSGCGYYNGR
ncbi:hypothetical protein ACVWYG_002576 [Pedobacter sp. UYEF25]